MSGKTISGNYSTNILLGDPASENPTTVAAGASIQAAGIAIYGIASTYWTIANYGSIDGTGNYGSGAGIVLGSGGTIYNHDLGTIEGSAYGIVLKGGGSVTNASGGTIEGGSEAAIRITGGAGSVANSGSILTTANDSVGVYLLDGGSVTNTASAVIDASFAAVWIKSAAGSVANYGTLHGGEYTPAVFLQVGGMVTNAASASITGLDAVDVTGAAGTIMNSGALTGNGFAGIQLAQGGYVDNAAGASINGVYYGATLDQDGTIVNSGSIHQSASFDTGLAGVFLYAGGTITNTSTGSITATEIGLKLGAAGSVLNSGNIEGSGATGIYLEQGGTITNTASGLIEGQTFGVFAGNLSSTVINAGTITGGNGTAISFAGSKAHELVIDPGAIFNGAVLGSASASNTLDLASGSNTGTISGLGTAFTNFGTVTLDSGASWDLQGANTLASGATVSGSGALTITHGASLTDSGDLINNADIVLNRGTLSAGNLDGAGSVTIDFGGKLDVQSAVGSDQNIIFNGIGLLDVNDPADFDGTIKGFSTVDVIDLTSTPHVGGQVDMDYSTNTLAVIEGGNIYSFQFDPSQNFTGDFFHLSTDGGGTDITMNTTPCYCAGTLIGTARGQRLVEDLKIGDRVKTSSGVLRPIKWIGTRSYGGRFLTGRKDILPVCIRAGALDENLPRRDLWISPHHAMFFKDEGVLIEAKDLVNGSSIVQARHVDKVAYFHVELDSHDVILAEEAPSETFLDDDSRAMFHNVGEYRDLYADAAAQPAFYCAPRVDSGYAIERVRQHIARREGLLRKAGQAA